MEVCIYVAHGSLDANVANEEKENTNIYQSIFYMRQNWKW